MKHILLIGIPALAGIIVFVILFRRRNRTTSPLSPPPEKKSDDSKKESPAPAPVATTRSYSWLWWLVVIAVLVGLGWWGYKHIQPPSQVSAPPRMDAPKKEMRQYVIKQELKFVGGDGAFEKDSLVGVRGDRPVFFATHTLPWRRDAVFHVVVKLLRRSTGQICLEINGGRGGTKFYMHPGSSEFATVVFFESGERGNPAYFNPGANQLKIWSLGDDMVIQHVSVEMIYRE